jgi:MoxR-like ATPase
LQRVFEAKDRVFLPQAVANYISRVVAATHPSNGQSLPAVAQYVSYGASPRAAIAMAEASRAMALLSGRPTVGFADVKAIAPAVLNHRMILNYKARFDQQTTGAIIDDLLKELDETGMDLPADIQVLDGEGGEK